MEATATTARKIHPVLQKMIQSGCQNQQKIAVAFQVYMELCEVEKLWNVRHHYNELHDFFYLTGKHSASSERDEIFIPLSITSDISPAWVENIQNEVCRNTSPKRNAEERTMTTTPDNSKLQQQGFVQSITLAIKEQDSTIVYYNVERELASPDSPETTQKKKKKQETRNLIESELHRQRLDIYESALNT
ncbi:uncharacterized protein LOC126480762 isoform X1 [Schistocerca serialis cubense]|uniref:uncharacterized protein LOC126480762 isoform X1 n=1 Tax=Schistocerca serialis cubense TaxID=2023355 RepID=UPI00214F4DEC|nr:uncharacterized protein LOC126480762 isoform X1 [Schistocerca serialis cubense]